jgi:hypothetical protein
MTIRIFSKSSILKATIVELLSPTASGLVLLHRSYAWEVRMEAMRQNLFNECPCATDTLASRVWRGIRPGCRKALEAGVSKMACP